MKRIVPIDVLGLLGILAVLEGVREVSRPAALILGGLIAVALAYLFAGERA